MRPRPQKPFLLVVAVLLSGCAEHRPTTHDPHRRERLTAPGSRLPVKTASEPASAPSPPRPLAPSSPPPLPAVFETRGPVVEPLRALVAEARRKKSARAVGIALIDLDRGHAYGVDPHRVFRPASVIKLAVMVAAYEAAPRMAPGAFDRLRPEIRRMITVSDNPSTRRLVLRLGKTRVNRAMQALGLPGLALSPQRTGNLVLVGSRATAAETALLLARLARRDVVSGNASKEMLALLGDQQRRNRIPAGTLAARRRHRGGASREGIWIGNKTGTLAGLVHDAGLVFEPDAGLGYALAIFTEGSRSEAAGVRLCATIAARVYETLSAR
jgi:beta-lactamase class A